MIHQVFIREVADVFVVGQECPKVEVPAPNSKPATQFQKEFLQVCVYVCVEGVGWCIDACVCMFVWGVHTCVCVTHLSYAGVSLSSVSGECGEPTEDQDGRGTTSISPVCHL